MKHIIALIALCVGITAAVWGLTIAADRAPEPVPGNSAVLSRINAETDCVALQGEFDRADANGHTDWMTAAHTRMTEIGCYR